MNVGGREGAPQSMKNMHTREEAQAGAIAKQLANALIRLEDFGGDIELVLDDVALFTFHAKSGVKAAVHAIRDHYITGGGDSVSRPKGKIEHVTVYHPDGSITEADPERGATFKWEELKAALGGYLETVRGALGPGTRVYVDEDGAAKDLAPNPRTWDFMNQRVYTLNGYASNWRVRGPIMVVCWRLRP
jgi:hypothetical protein